MMQDRHLKMTSDGHNARTYIGFIKFINKETLFKQCDNFGLVYINLSMFSIIVKRKICNWPLDLRPHKKFEL